VATSLHFYTSGESHGPRLLAILEGLPAGLPIDISAINQYLQRRQRGYGRSRRMQIESDTICISSGIRHGQTLGTPVGLSIENRDWANWQQEMSPEPPDEDFVSQRQVTVPRPGHADLAGAAKFGHQDMRNVLERASARETAARVAVGAICQQLLSHFDISVCSCVTNIGGVEAKVPPHPGPDFFTAAQASDVGCADPEAATQMRAAIDQAQQDGDTVGGIFTVYAYGVPPGLGSMANWQQRLDGRLAAALMSIPAIKSVEVGLGREVASRPGSAVHDPIQFAPQCRPWPFVRPTNNAGGLEGGMTNGEPVVLRAAMKPISTLLRPLPSVSLDTFQPSKAHVERSDICAVPAAAVVGEAMVAFIIAQAFREKFGGDSVADVRAAYQAYYTRLGHWGAGKED